MTRMNRSAASRIIQSALALSLCLLAFAPTASAQGRRSAEKYGDKLLSIDVSEITLESIDFRDQTARLSVGLDVSNRLVPISLKDFDYRLRLYGLDVIEGNYDGVMKIGGKRPSRIELPVAVSLRSIPAVVWSAFSNRGRLRFDLDTAFTVPLFLFEKRFDKSFSGEVPLRSLVDAASILRARRLNGVDVGGILNRH
jgi:hypothetical protein